MSSMVEKTVMDEAQEDVERSPSQWLRFLTEHQRKVNFQLRSGCSRGDFERLQCLNEALTIVIGNMESRVDSEKPGY